MCKCHRDKGPFCFRDEYLAKIARRVKEYKINVLNEPRPGKKLLVLDVDYTLFGKFHHTRYHRIFLLGSVILYFAVIF